MLIEATTPLRLKLPTEEVHLQPGVPVDLPFPYAQRLLERAPGKVRALVPGDRVSWISPLFGRLSGELIGVRTMEMVVVYHPLAETIREIPLAWLTRSSPS